MNIQTVLGHTRQHLRTEGLKGTVLYEHRYGISTEGVIEGSELGFESEEFGEYQPTDYTDFAKIMRALATNPSEHVFVDLGAGMGRAMILAATYPFKRVRGVEFSAELTRIAKRNIEKSLPKLKCRDVELAAGDAALYRLPEDATIFYFNNSFTGATLERVLENIKAAAARGPRPMLVVCNLPANAPFEDQIRAHTWLAPAGDIRLNDSRKCLIFRTLTSG